MNLFLVGFGLSDFMEVAATKALRSIRTVYPQLDLDTLTIWNNRNAFLGTLHTNSTVASPREYIAKSPGYFTFFLERRSAGTEKLFLTTLQTLRTIGASYRRSWTVNSLQFELI